MRRFGPKSLDTAFVRPGTPSFADVICYLEDNPELFSTRTRDMISGLRRVARALGREPEEVPADPRWLQPRLEKIVPAALGISPKTWSNAQSDARAGLSRFGVVDRRSHRKSDLSPEWRPLWALAIASGDKTLPTALRRLVYFLSGRGVAPAEVTDADALAYREALVENEISKSPEVAWRAAVNGWNLAVRLLPDWPQHRLALPNRQKLVKLPDATFPQSLHDDLARLAETLAKPDPLAEGGRARAVRPATIVQYRRRLLCFAAELVRAGVPAEQITSVAMICAPEIVERGLRQMLARTENKTNRMISETAGLLRNLAGSYCAAAEEAHKGVAELARRVAMKPQTGMTRKNRDRLRVLQDPSNLKALLLLPDRLFNEAKADRKPYYRALDREIAVAIAILLVCPIRVKNLSEIDLERNLQRPGDGRVLLVFEEEDVKNDRHLEFELPADVARMIDRHLQTRAPELCPPGSPWLFPRRDGQSPIDGNALSVRITKLIRRVLGLVVNVHLFRHLAVMIWLEANPGGYEAARRLLDHSAISHTLNLYAGLEGRSATLAFSRLIQAKKEPRPCASSCPSRTGPRRIRPCGAPSCSPAAPLTLRARSRICAPHRWRPSSCAMAAGSAGSPSKSRGRCRRRPASGPPCRACGPGWKPWRTSPLCRG